MKFRCERDDLLEAVQVASRAISNRATLPVLSGLRIEAKEQGEIGIAATDLELTIETGFAAGVDEPGRVIVPGRLFSEMTRSLGAGQVLVAGGDGEVEIGSGRGEFRVKALAPDDYPALPTEDGRDEAGSFFDVASETLGRALSQVVRSASGDESRQVLTGVLWEVEQDRMTLAATDSYRLSVREVSFEGAGGSKREVILPARALGELGRALQASGERVRVEVRPNLMIFTLQGTEGSSDKKQLVASRFIEGDFPKYRQLLPQGYTNVLSVERDPLVDVVKRVGLLAQNNMPVKLRLGNELEVSAHTPDVGEGQEVIDCEYKGEPLVIAFNPHFLIEGAQAMQSEKVLLEVGDGLKPAVLKGEGDDSFTYLLMPVRLS